MNNALDARQWASAEGVNTGLVLRSYGGATRIGGRRGRGVRLVHPVGLLQASPVLKLTVPRGGVFNLARKAFLPAQTGGNPL